MNHLIEFIVSWAVGLVQRFGYAGIFVTQALESVLVPIPSEVVLPFSGYLAATGAMSIWLVTIVATCANLVGAILAYLIGHYGGRPLLERYGRYVLIFKSDITKMDRLVTRHGGAVAFISRLIPGLRTFSSLIIGSFRIHFGLFVAYTFAGSFIWNFVLAYIGYRVGQRWDILRPYFHKFEIVIAVAIAVIVVLFIRKQWRKIKEV